MDYTTIQKCLKEWLEEEYTYWTHEGIVFRIKNTITDDDFIEALGPGGWTEIL